MRTRGLVKGGARACALRVAVRCDARVEAGARGLAAGRARASCVTGLRIYSHLTNPAPRTPYAPSRSVSPLISLPVCKNSSHSPSPFPCLSPRHRGGIGATCPPPANISRLGRILSHGDPKRAPGAEFCALLHDALACVHACRACCSCLVQKSGPCARLPVRASRCGCMLSLHICELMHDITSISYVH